METKILVKEEAMVKKTTLIFLLTAFYLLTTLSYAQPDKELFNKANSAFVNREFKEARQLFKRYLALYPKGEDAAFAEYNIAESLYQEGEFQQAVPIYEKVVSSYKDKEIGMDASNRVGDCYQKLQDREKAREAYQKVVKNYPNTRQAEYAAYSLKWLKVADEKEKKKKVEQVKPAAEVNPKGKKQEEKVSKEAQLKLAKDLFQLKKYKEARSEFEKFLKNYPNDKFSSYAQLKLAETYYYENDYKNAVKEYQKLKNYPSDKYTIYGKYAIGWGYYHLGDYQQALKDFEEFLKEYPESAYAPSAKDALLKIGGLVKEKEATDLYNQAKIAYEGGDLKKTLSLLSKIINEYPETSRLEEVKKVKTKIEEKLHRLEAEGLFKEAQEAQEAKNFFLAREKLEKIIAQYPAETEYVNKAKLSLEKVNQILEENARLEYEKGKKLLEASSYKEAEKKFEEISRLFSKTVYGDLASKEVAALKAKNREEKAKELLGAGVANLREGNPEKAKERFLKILEEYPDTQSALKAKGHLDEISKDLREKEAYALYRSALSDLEKERYQEAVESLKTLLSSYPFSKIRDEAKKAFEVALQELANKKAADHYYVAKRLFELGKSEEAKEIFLKIKEEFPETNYAKLADKFISGGTPSNKEEIVVLQGEGEKEKEGGEKAVIDKQAEGIFAKANQLRRLGDFKQALSQYELLLRKYPESKEAPYAAYAKAEIFYFWENNYQKALEGWKAIIKNYPSSELIPHVLYYLATTYENLGQKKEAQKTYRKLLNDFPESIYGSGELLEMIKKRIGE